MPQIDKYTAGTVTLTNGSATVTGNATNWISGGLYSVVAGHWFRYGSFTSLIVAVNSATSITLATPYSGSTASGLSYEIFRYTRLETPEAVGFLQSLLARGSAANPFTRVDVDSGSVRASLRDDGTGQLGLYIGTAGSADGSQIKAATINKTTGVVTFSASPFSTSTLDAAFRAVTSGADKASFYGLGDSVGDLGAVLLLAGPSYSGFGGGGSLNLFNIRSGPLAFGTANTERMRIAAGGNVGIGTIAPTTPLDVAGQIRSSDGTADIRLLPLGSSNVGIVGTASNHDLVLWANAAERMRVRATGNVGIGTAAPAARLDIQAAADNADAFLIRAVGGAKFLTVKPETALNTAQMFYWNGTGTGTLQVTGLQLGSTCTFNVDNSYDVGSASFRARVLYAGTGTINTSDAREKTKVRPLSPAELRAAQRLAMEIGVYQWLEAVKEKGEAARQHVGMTVQRAVEIMEEEGLDPWAYGFMCRDEIIRKVKVMQKRMVAKVEEVEVSYVEIEVRDGVPVQVTKTRTDKRPVMQMVPVLDEAGKPVLQEVQATEEVTETYTEIEMRDGKPVQLEKKRTVKVPVFETVQVVNAKGEPVTEEVEIQKGVDEKGEPITAREKRPVTTQVPVMTTEPVMHSIPVMIEEEVEVEIEEPAGDRLGFRPDQIDRFIMRGLAEKIALLEGK